MNKALLIEQIAIQAGISIEDATEALERFEKAMSDSGDKSDISEQLSNLSRNITPEDECLPTPPLWMVNQRNKTFKRGKK